ERHRARVDAGVVARAPDDEVEHGADAGAADAPQRARRGGARRVVAGQRVGLGPEDRHAAAAAAREREEVRVGRDPDVGLDGPWSSEAGEMPTEEAGVRGNRTEAMAGE